MRETSTHPPAGRRPANPFFAALALGFALVALAPQTASAEVFVGFSSGGFHHHFHHPFFFGPRVFFARPPIYYGPPAYYGPPPVVYAAPPAPVYVPTYSRPMRVNPASAPYRAENGRTCREYQTTVTVGGRPQNAYGTACLEPDGAWRIAD
jgi:hypothetical protein